MPRKPIVPEDVARAIERLKGKKAHKRRRVMLHGHTHQKPMYGWPSITITAIAKEVKCARGTLYALADENRKAEGEKEEIKQARRFYRILKPYMRTKKDNSTAGEPKRNTLEYYKQLAQKRGKQLEKYHKLRKEMLENKLKFDDLEVIIDDQAEVIAELKKYRKEVNQDYIKTNSSNKKLLKENSELRQKLMISESKLRGLSKN